MKSRSLFNSQPAAMFWFSLGIWMPDFGMLLDGRFGLAISLVIAGLLISWLLWRAFLWIEQRWPERAS